VNETLHDDSAERAANALLDENRALKERIEALEKADRISMDNIVEKTVRIEALERVRHAAEKYRNSHTMAGANVEGESISDFIARIVKERAVLDEALAALAAHRPEVLSGEETTG
jgi:hypothetical protein